jgi:hypothetical protein
MEILDGKDQRLVPAVMQHEVPQEHKEPRLTLLWTKARQARIVHRHIKQLEEQGDVILWSKVGLLYILVYFGCDAFHPVSIRDAPSLTEQVTHWQIRNTAAIRETVPFPIGHRLSSQATVEFREQPRFSYTSLSGNADHLAVPLYHMRQAFMQKREFLSTPHKATAMAGPLTSDSCPALCESLHRVHSEMFPSPLKGRHLKDLDPHLVLH